MLESLTLENFQAHKKLVIQFDRRVTVIVGPSDTGKSSIIRALGWVAFNRPGGDQFIRHGAKLASATLHVDGQVIVRSRSKSENLYLLDGAEFKAFGNDVPADIKALLKIDEINFQDQHDSPFWFSETAGEVSRQLNQIVNLGVIDSVLGFVAARVRSTRDLATQKGDRVEQLKKRVTEQKPILQVHDHLQELEDLREHLNDKVERNRRLESLLASAERWRETARSAKDLVESGSALAELGETARIATKRVSRLNELGRNVASLTKQVSVEIPDLKPLEAKLAAAKEAQALHNRLYVLEQGLANAIYRLDKAKTSHLSAESEFHTRIKGERCPTCGKVM
jgi:exonuclease SbcC